MLRRRFFLKDYESHVVIGVNSPDAFTQANIQLIEEVFNRVVLQHGANSLYSLACYNWNNPGEQAPHYGQIRSKLFSLPINTSLMQRMKQVCAKVFYVTLDPDTQLTPQIMKEFELKERSRFSPFVICGFYHFESDNLNSQLVQEDGSLNWSGFLARADADGSAMVKKTIAELTISQTKYPYTFSVDTSRYRGNLESLKSLFPKNGQLQDLAINNLKFDLKNTMRSPSDKRLKEMLKKQEDDLAARLHKLTLKEKTQPLTPAENKVLKLNHKRSIPASIMLYPPEPLLFMSLFQKKGPLVCDLHALIHNKNLTNLSGEGPTQEGVALVANIKALWRQVKREVPELKKYAEPSKKKYVDFTFEYATAMPERCLYIPPHVLAALPQNVDELQEMLGNNSSRETLVCNLQYLFRARPQTALSENLYSHAKNRLGIKNCIDEQKPHQYSPRTYHFLCSQVDKQFKNFVELKIQEFLDHLLVALDQECSDYFKNEKNLS